jgi:hypothetical protein
MTASAGSNDQSAADRALQLGLAKAIARSWRDPAFRDQLEADPSGALAELGVDVPADVDIRVVPEGTVVLPIAEPPSGDQEAAARAIAEEALARLLGDGAA